MRETHASQQATIRFEDCTCWQAATETLKCDTRVYPNGVKQ
jgi:hypothetical protein